LGCGWAIALYDCRVFALDWWLVQCCPSPPFLSLGWEGYFDSWDCRAQNSLEGETAENDCPNENQKQRLVPLYKVSCLLPVDVCVIERHGLQLKRVTREIWPASRCRAARASIFWHESHRHVHQCFRQGPSLLGQMESGNRTTELQMVF
jgi:hypothetical protein